MTTKQRQQPLRQGHVPMRTCVGCRRERAKREMVRIVRTPEGAIEVDSTGKKAGRGAYLCAQRTCWEQAVKRQRLGASLHTTIDAAVSEALLAHGQIYPAEEA